MAEPPTSTAEWVLFAPDLSQANGEAWLRRAARALVRGDTQRALRLTLERDVRVDPATNAAMHVLIDLATHGWELRVRHQLIEVRRPSQPAEAHESQRDRIRAQHQRASEEQLQTQASRDFVRALETRRIYAGHFVSVFSLMRDGRELAPALRAARRFEGPDRVEHLRSLIRPYLELATEQGVCTTTGIRLQEIWRYFRHTWANAYVSVPGRSMMVLVRDAASPLHPVIGIASLGSAVVQSSVRDRWLGWDPKMFLERISANPDLASARWLASVVERSLRDVYVEDLLADKVMTQRDLHTVSPTAIEALYALARSARQDHKHGDPRERKRTAPRLTDDEPWLREARSELYRSKRATALALLLTAKATLANAFRGGAPSIEGLKRLIHSSDGRRVVAQLVRRAKAEAVGISIADIMICGAIPPYSHLLGGKLVAMLLSPEIVQAYRERYTTAESVIASSIAGRAIRRAPRLVALSTTSLYGVPLNQYTNIAIPCGRVGGARDQSVRYQRLGETVGFGSYQFTNETCRALIRLNPLDVNYVFGEGVNPKMRAIRGGLDSLDLPSDQFLNHGNPRVVYGVSLARNVREILLGVEAEPDYLLPLQNGAEATDNIASWWTERWLAKRIERDDVLERVATESLVFPIRHRARVRLPATDQLEFFDES